MESLAAGLTRQAVVIAGASALLVGAIYGGVSQSPRESAAKQNIEAPIRVQSVSLAPATPLTPEAVMNAEEVAERSTALRLMTVS